VAHAFGIIGVNKRSHKLALFLRQNREREIVAKNKDLGLRPLGLRPLIALIVPGTSLAAVKLCQLCQVRVGGIIGAQGRQSGRSGELVSRHSPRTPGQFEDRLGAGVVCGTLDLGPGAISRFQRARQPY
jgi:hypothetical protein